MSRYLVGIDLGTTNSAVAFIDLKIRPKNGTPPIQTFPVTQLVGPGQTGERPLLPSFLYVAGEHDLPPEATRLPWDAASRLAVGEFARRQGAKVPGRLVLSAKSWLGHSAVDRTAPMLPFGAPPDVPRLSPLEVSTRYLAHMSAAWDAAHPADEKFAEQQVVLTVPASFDDVARQLTQQAARDAGMKNVSLLEEPQAAFYCWLGKSSPDEAAKVSPGMRCLVVDVGGGTSDFSLIRATEEKGELGFIREAVGDHLLLGGDNMDMALARHVEAKLGQSGKLDAAQFTQLVQNCRNAKEQLLGPNPPASVPVTVLGRGRSVIGGTLSSALTYDELRTVFFDGFMPFVGRDETPKQAGRGGLQEMGLPYVQDPAITRHLAAFVRSQIGVNDPGPETILFNGGVFQPPALRERLVEVMRQWYADQSGGWNPLVLASPSLDLAVAWGAAYSAWLKHTGGKRIGGGIPRSYYLGIDSGGEAKVLCVVPRRLEEGGEVRLDQPELELALGEPVLFPIYSSTVRGDDKPGDVVSAGAGQLLALPPMHTILRGGKRGGVKRIPVRLAARSTEIGTLELFCESRENDGRWRLEFNVRDVLSQTPTETPDDGTASAPIEMLPESAVEKAVATLGRCYGSNAPPLDPKELVKELEADLELSRDEWPTGVCRRIWEPLSALAPERKRSSGHLGRWHNMAGFVLRPGYGDALDRYRVDALWKLINQPQSANPLLKSAPATPEGGAESWVMWRRVSGGLTTPQQQQLLTRMRPMLMPQRGKQVVKPGANELAEMWRCAASLERLDLSLKAQLGNALLKQLDGPAPNYLFWSLTRLGTRKPIYGPMNAVIHPHTAENWLVELMKYEPPRDEDRLGAAFAMSQIARRTGNRGLDVDDETRAAVLDRLSGWTVPAEWKRAVAEVVEDEAATRTRMLGDTLPIGLRLRA